MLVSDDDDVDDDDDHDADDDGDNNHDEIYNGLHWTTQVSKRKIWNLHVSNKIMQRRLVAGWVFS